MTARAQSRQNVYTFSMMAFRPLGYLLLVVALIANGLVADGMAMTAAAPSVAAVTPAEPTVASEHGGCHETTSASAAVDDQAPSGAPMRCCDGTSCKCACLQHAPAVLLTFSLPELVRFSPPPVLGELVTLPSAPAAPQLRPPIA
jgi:hypothetical protein